MKRKIISSVLAVCMCAAMTGGLGAGAAEETTTETSAAEKTLFFEDFESKADWDVNKTYFDIPEAYGPFCDERADADNAEKGWKKGEFKAVGRYIKQQVTPYSYNYNQSQQGDMASYYTASNVKYSNGGYSRALTVRPEVKEGKTDWQIDIKLAACDPSYGNLTVGQLSEKALDVSVLMAYTDEATDGKNLVVTTEEPLRVLLVYTVDGQEKTCELGRKPINKSKNGTLNNGVHVRNSLKGILADASADAAASDIRVRFTGKMESDLKWLRFDNFLIKEVNPKVIFSENFDERSWFGFVTSTDFLTDVQAVDTISGVDMTNRGKALRVSAKSEKESELKYEHPFEFPIKNADNTKCYEVKADICYPESNAAKDRPEVWLLERTDNEKILLANLTNDTRVDKSNDFVTYTFNFDFSKIAKQMKDTSNLRLMVKFGVGQHAHNDSLYIDNVSVTEVPVENIQPQQGSNYFDDTSTLKNGELNISFRDTETECVGIAAAYAKDGSLVSVERTNVTTAEPASIAVNVTDGIQTVSAFAWAAGLNSIKPVLPAITVTKAE